jgi:DNA-binding MarR family transcriptional regulator
MDDKDAPISDAEYQRLLAFRTELRRFTRWSESAAKDAGLTPALHQLLLAIRGLSVEAPPPIGDVAEVLLVRHHSAVELVARAEALHLITRGTSTTDHREVRLRLTQLGAERLQGLSRQHLGRLQQVSDAIRDVLEPSPRPSTRTLDGPK